MRHAVWADSFESEPVALKGRNDLLDSGRCCTDVDNYIAVLADLRRNLAVLEPVQQHHLAVDQRPGHRERLTEVE
jgi:hypothetical protein